jgi:GrpB-like predicted nucleotidyltransferase (UPF0157 family)
MQWLTDAGLGLDDQTVRLVRTTRAAVEAGTRLRDDVADLVADLVADVEQVGSSSVVDLLAKPIVDLAIGLTADQPLAPVCERLEAAGWVYRGDAGAQGGHVFVLRVRPGHRVAHIHVVDHDGDQWRNYLRLRDLLRRSPQARARYGAVKQHLVAQVGDDRVAYTDGKSDVVGALLAWD